MEKGAVIKHKIKNAPNTGEWRNYVPDLNSDKCIGCGTCVKYCPEACIELRQMDNKRKKADIDKSFCKGCGVCAEVCPVKAIIMK